MHDGRERALADDDRVDELHRHVACVARPARRHAPHGGAGGEAAGQRQRGRRQVLGAAAAPSAGSASVHDRHYAPIPSDAARSGGHHGACPRASPPSFGGTIRCVRTLKPRASSSRRASASRSDVLEDASAQRDRVDPGAGADAAGGIADQRGPRAAWKPAAIAPGRRRRAGPPRVRAARVPGPCGRRRRRPRPAEAVRPRRPASGPTSPRPPTGAPWPPAPRRWPRGAPDQRAHRVEEAPHARGRHAADAACRAGGPPRRARAAGRAAPAPGRRPTRCRPPTGGPARPGTGGGWPRRRPAGARGRGEPARSKAR